MTLQQAEAVLVRRALAEQEGDRERAAFQLGLTLEQLEQKIRLFDL